MLKIKDIKNSQFFYGKNGDGTAYEFRAYGSPFQKEGVWHIEATDAGDYCFTFNELDESILYPSEEMTDE